jgi:hypothetical protein
MDSFRLLQLLHFRRDIRKMMAMESHPFLILVFEN